MHLTKEKEINSFEKGMNTKLFIKFAEYENKKQHYISLLATVRKQNKMIAKLTSHYAIHHSKLIMDISTFNVHNNSTS